MAQICNRKTGKLFLGQEGFRYFAPTKLGSRGKVLHPHRRVETVPRLVPDNFRMSVGDSLRILAPNLRMQCCSYLTSPTDCLMHVHTVCCLKIVVVCISFVRHHSALRDTEKELVSATVLDLVLVRLDAR